MEKTDIIMENYQVEAEEKMKVAYSKNRKKQVQMPKKMTVQEMAKIIGIAVVGVFFGNGVVLQIVYPMGMTYLSLFLGEGVLFWSAFVGVMLGSFGNVPVKSWAVLASALAIQLTFGKFVSRSEMLKKALIASFGMLLAGVFYAIGQGGLTFYFVLGVVESALVLGFSLLAQKGSLCLFEKSRVFAPTKEEMLGLLFLLGGALVGIASMEMVFFREGLLACIGAYCIAICGWREGMGGGAGAGMLLGFMLYISGGIDVYMITAFGISGLLVGSFKELGRVLMGLILLLTPLVFFFYTDVHLVSYVWFFGWAMGAVLFVLTPKKWIYKATGELWVQEQARAQYLQRQELIEERLLGFSKAFRGLAKSFTLETEDTERKEIEALVEQIAESACADCSVNHYCWEEDLYRSYSTTLSAISYCESKGGAKLRDMSPNFQENCVRAQAFVDTVNRVYENYKKERVWHGKLQECRGLVKQQLEAVSHIIEGLSGKLEPTYAILEQVSIQVKEACRKEKIPYLDIVVMEEKQKKGRQVKVELKGCGGRGVCKDRLLATIRKTMEIPVALRQGNMCQCGADGICRLVYAEEPLFQLTTAVAFASAQGGEISGDNASFLETENGISLMAISDGMGKGEKASEESKTAIELLEEFTEAGFERDLAVQMINSALLLRKGRESYATLDICAVDLFDGNAEFIKMGAVSSFIYRGERIMEITSNSLPAGILQSIEVVKSNLRLKDGDFLFLFTDGMCDALGGEMKMAQWLKEKLLAVSMANPQDIAEYILAEVKKECNAQLQDDAMVMVGRFWKRRRIA